MQKAFSELYIFFLFVTQFQIAALISEDHVGQLQEALLFQGKGSSMDSGAGQWDFQDHIYCLHHKDQEK